MSYLVPQPPQTFNSTIRRFEPAFWDCDFNLEATATVITTGPNSLRLKGLLRTNHCLIGLFFRSRDKYNHPLFSYKQIDDWSNCTLDFDLSYSGSPAVDATTNPLTITVNDKSGKSYFLPVSQFCTPATGTSVHVTIDFSTAVSGYPPNTIPVPWSFIDCMFIGFASADFNNTATLAPLASEIAVQADLTNITVTGTNSTIPINTTALSAHELHIADGYADSYPQTPERLVNQIVNLGYRGDVTLYMGFTQYHSLSWDTGVGYLQVDDTKQVINDPTRQWVTDYATRLHTAGISLTISLSFEILGKFAPDAWVQKDWSGAVGWSGWTPPSAFYSPCSTSAMAYLQNCAKTLVGQVTATGCTAKVQVGEPWWWPGGYYNQGPCIYDANTQAAYTAATSQPVPTPFLETIYDDYSATAQTNYLTWLQGQLGAATLAVKSAVKTAYPGTAVGVLFYTPTVSNPASPMVELLDFPTSSWTSPAWDFVQVEDYEVIEFGNFAQQLKDLDVPVHALGYSLTPLQYFSGFNLLAPTTFIWDAIDEAIWAAFNRKSYPVCLVWARPQVCRDGWVYDHGNWSTYAAAASQANLPTFPTLRGLSWDVKRTPTFATLVSTHVDGTEIRSPQTVWPQWVFELTYQSLADNDAAQSLQTLKSFFESMAGRDGRFLFSDPEFNTVTDGAIGTGDGFATDFTLQRALGTFVEPIMALGALTNVKVNGVVQAGGSYQAWFNELWPQVRFATPPAAGATITATFTYLFVCRFDDDTQKYVQQVLNLHALQSCKFRTVKPS